MRQRILAWFHGRPAAQAWALLAPGVLFLSVFYVVPLGIVLTYSTMNRDPMGGVDPGFTLQHYAQVTHWLYLKILLKTTLYAFACTAVCLVMGYPVAYVVARAGRWKNALLLGVVLPFWTSFLVRTFAMIFLMRDTGLINTTLHAVGLVGEDGLPMLDTPFAVMTGLVYGFLPFMILPIYSSLEKLDLTLLEAAEVLGARPAARFLRVTLPLSMPGVIAGSLLVFVPALGSFLTSDLLGGAKEYMIGNVIQAQFGAARNWPFGSAASFALMMLVLAAVLVYLRVRDAAAEAGR